MPNLLAQADIARKYKVSPVAVGKWIKRPDFPEPSYRQGDRPLWTSDQIELWFLRHKRSTRTGV